MKTEIHGAKDGLVKQTRLLNRVLAWETRGITWEPDPRHAALLWRDLGFDNTTKSTATPGTKDIDRELKIAHAKSDGREYECSESNEIHCYDAGAMDDRRQGGGEGAGGKV